MIYWHVDNKSACIYSQLKNCTSSEVASMLKGFLSHNTKMKMGKTYVDTHGQSMVGFAISQLLGFELLPRLKNINKQKLYCPEKVDEKKFENLELILDGPIDWQQIEDYYDEVVKYIVALKKGIVESDVLIKRFSQNNFKHPVYKALLEMGKAIKTQFLCRYLEEEELRIEINESLNVVERLNDIMGFIFYGKLGEISTNIKEDQELAISCLHLLQVCMVYINTLIIQEVLAEPEWKGRLTPEDLRALTPIIHAHINPYGLFPLDLVQRLKFKASNQGQVGERLAVAV
jgi:TnpA family transposase